MAQPPVELAEGLGLDLDIEAMAALSELSEGDARSLLEQVDWDRDTIRNPSAYVIKTVQHGYERRPFGSKAGASSSIRPAGGGGGKGGKSAARAEELGLKLSQEAIDAVSSLPLSNAFELLEGAAERHDIRNMDSYLVRACQKIQAGEAPPARGGRSAARAEELGLNLSQRALEALASAPLADALDLLEKVASKGSSERNPSGFIVNFCNHLQEERDAVGHQGCGRGKGSRSAARAEELGLELSDPALEALAGVPLQEALQLVEDANESSVRNPSGYVVSACQKMLSAHDARRNGDSRAADRSYELGLRLTDFALEALRTVPLGDAYQLLEDVAEKGTTIRDQSRYVSVACNKITNREGMPRGVAAALRDEAPRGRGHCEGERRPWREGRELAGLAKARRGRGRDLEARVLDLNRQRAFGDKQIDVEALVALKSCNLADAQDLLDSVEDMGQRVRDPSRYIVGAVNKMGHFSSSHSGSRGLKRAIDALANAEEHAYALGLRLSDAALDALAAVPLDSAYSLLDQVAANIDRIKDVSNYIIATCHRGINGSGPPSGSMAMKRPRLSSAPRSRDDRG